MPTQLTELSGCGTAKGGAGSHSEIRPAGRVTRNYVSGARWKLRSKVTEVSEVTQQQTGK